MNQDHIFYRSILSNKEITKNTILDLAIVRTNSDGEVLARHVDKITFETNYSDGYVTFAEALKSIQTVILNDYTDKYVIVSLNGFQDKNLFTAECKKNNLKDLFEGRLWVDLSQLAWPLLYCGSIENRQITTLYRYYNIIPEELYTACGEVEGIQQIYWKMMKRFSMANTVEQKVKDVASDFVGGFISKLGF